MMAATYGPWSASYSGNPCDHYAAGTYENEKDGVQRCPRCGAERTVVASGRRHDVPGCPRCDREPTVYHPSHDASSRCESGGREHCSCDVCF